MPSAVTFETSPVPHDEEIVRAIDDEISAETFSRSNAREIYVLMNAPSAVKIWVGFSRSVTKMRPRLSIAILPG